MRVVLMCNNWGGLQVLQFLMEQGEQVVAIVAHNPKKQKYLEEIIEYYRENIGEETPTVIYARQLRKTEGIETMKALRPDIIICAFFQYILKKPIIDIPPLGCVNLHPAYLPINRGWQPNEWPILDGSPAGVCIHYIDEGIDTGDIIVREKMVITSVDTGESIHRRLVDAMVQLFRDKWGYIKTGPIGVPQHSLETPTHHFKKEIQRFNEIDLMKLQTPLSLINTLRARTYPPYPGCYFVDPETGRKIYVWIKLCYEEDLKRGDLPKWG